MDVHIHLCDTLGQCFTNKSKLFASGPVSVCRGSDVVVVSRAPLELGDVVLRVTGGAHEVTLVCYENAVQLHLAYPHASLVLDAVLDSLATPTSKVYLHIKNPPKFVNNTIRFEDKVDLYCDLLKDLNLRHKLELV